MGLTRGSKLRPIRRRPASVASPREVLTDFANSLVRADLSLRTVEGYRYDLEMFRRWLEKTRGQDVNLLAVLATDLMSRRHPLLRVEKSRPTTINRRLQALRRFYRWAKKSGLVASDPTEDIKTVRIDRAHQPRGLAQPEVHALLRAAGGSGHGLARRNYAVIQLLLQTGLRVGEVATLCAGDITLHERSGSVRVREGKGRKARDVPLNATARRALR